ncbi:MAG: hypothetical protein ACLFOY_07625 [Desulfatibacillaceae bacterium]
MKASGMRTITSIVALATMALSFCASAQAKEQVVTFSSSVGNVAPGDNFNVTVEYGVTDSNTSLNGLAMNVFFSSGDLEYVGSDGFLDIGDVMVEPKLSVDARDLDGDPMTDMFISLAWVSFSKSWPGTALPVSLAGLQFTVQEGAAGTVSLKPVIVESAANYEARVNQLSIPVMK